MGILNKQLRTPENRRQFAATPFPAHPLEHQLREHSHQSSQVLLLFFCHFYALLEIGCRGGGRGFIRWC